MDIKNIFDFEDKINYLLKSESDIKDSIKDQGDYLNSDIINANFGSIEKEINSIYEKSRVLEEIIDYAKIYVNNEIETTITECKDLLLEIENLNEIFVNDSKNYIAINVPIASSHMSNNIDRDGSIINTCSVYNGVLTLSGARGADIIIDNIQARSSEQCIETNIENFPQEAYRVHYLLDDISNIGIIENIYFNFKTAQKINSIKLKISNCELIDITYIYEDGTEEVSTETKCPLVRERIVKSIKVRLKSANYTAIDSGYSVSTYNFFDNSSNDTYNAQSEYADSFIKYSEKE